MRGRTSVAALLVGALLALAGCTGGGDDDSSGTKRPLPVALPEVTLAGFDGGPELELAELRGPAVINLWASYCQPCRQEMPVLEEFARKHEGRVQMIGIDFQDPREGAAEELVAETGVTYPLYADFEGVVAEAPMPRMPALPFLHFVDEQGRVVAWEMTEVTSVPQLEDYVTEHLGVDLEGPA